MRYRCHCGVTARISLQDFLKGGRCGCGRKKEGTKRRHSIEYVKRYFADHRCELLEETYEGNHKPMRFRCECGNEEGRVCFADFKNGVRCGCRRHLGLNRIWTKERVLEELKTLIAAHQHFPAANELRQMRKGRLGNAIQSLGGFNYFRHLLHHELATKPTGYWKRWENVERELRAEFGETIGRGCCPNSRMVKETGIPTRILTRFGGMAGIAQRLDCDLASCWRAQDGHVVFSFLEFILDEYLYATGLPHHPQLQLSPNRKYRCDQRVGDYYIEVFGYGRADRSSRAIAYNRKRKTKEHVYRSLGLNLVPIEKEVFSKPYPEIERYLDELFRGLGFIVTRKSPFDISDLAQRAGFFLTEEQVVDQLKEIIQSTGRFPTQRTLHQLGRSELVWQINKTGGLIHYREKLGCVSPVKPSGYWTFHRTTERLRIQASKLGRLPLQKEMGTGLAHAVQKHGGINALAVVLGLTCHKKPNGWWRDTKALCQILEDEVVSIVGHFPTPQDLQRLGRYDLLNAIARHGGFRAFRKEQTET